MTGVNRKVGDRMEASINAYGSSNLTLHQLMKQGGKDEHLQYRTETLSATSMKINDFNIRQPLKKSQNSRLTPVS
jgi:hypothetical protein